VQDVVGTHHHEEATLMNVMVELMSVDDYTVFKETVQKANDDMFQMLLA
jgi:hypothetical protein